MLPESASSRDLRVDASGIATEPDPQDDLHLKLNEMVAAVLDIEEVVFSEPEEKREVKGMADILGAASGTPIAARFVGRLRLNSEAAYDQLDADFKTIQHTPLFRLEEGKHVVLALRGRIDPKPRPWWPNLALFVATLFSVLLVGLNLAVGEIANENIFRASRIMNDFPANLVYGLPFALSILLILGSHELGHYFAARRHGIAVTLPYFIPLPFVSLLGTLGAFIQLQQPLRNRKVLLDVGAAGPLTGLIFAVPILLIGLAGARVDLALPSAASTKAIQSSMRWPKSLTFGQFLPNGGLDVVITSNQLAWAGWTGLLVSALNLIPIGQLDGGHILYALLGERARRLYFPLMIAWWGCAFDRPGLAAVGRCCCCSSAGCMPPRWT